MAQIFFKEIKMDILLTGSVAYDYLMTFPGLFKEQILPERLASISLSFLVESMSKQRGGIAPNIAYTMAPARSTIARALSEACEVGFSSARRLVSTTTSSC